jgi:hypothetical protein
MRIKHFYLFGLTLLLIEAKAQVPNEVLNDSTQWVQPEEKPFGFELKNTNYFRNTEYFNRIEEGRTLFGYQLHPSISYRAHPAIKLETGIWLRHDFGGNTPYTTALPTFSLRAKGNSSELIFGTLDGALSHGLLEPMLDINAVITQRIENGFQFKFNSGALKADNWINWQNYIEPGAFDKERFTAGVNWNLRLFENAQARLESYYMATVFHQGGQIDLDTLQPYLMQLNDAVGVKFKRTISKGVSWFIDANLLRYLELSDSKLYEHKKGIAYFANVGFCDNGFNVMISYWQGNHFISPGGTQIYQSRSSIDAANYERNRQLLIARFIYNKALYQSPVMASARLEPIYDLNNKILDFSFSLYLSYRLNYWFGKK